MLKARINHGIGDTPTPPRDFNSPLTLNVSGERFKVSIMYFVRPECTACRWMKSASQRVMSMSISGAELAW